MRNRLVCCQFGKVYVDIGYLTKRNLTPDNGASQEEIELEAASHDGLNQMIRLPQNMRFPPE